jgi:hypothetical protein
LTLHRHLLPHEFDLLLDEEVGFGVPPLRAHARDCPQCAAELADARTAMNQLERIPRLVPSPLFAERVMARVHVFRPWYATALDVARRLIPQPGPIRTVVATAAALACVTLTLLGLWIATRADQFLAFAALTAEQARLVGVELAGTLFGGAAVAAIQTGGRGTLAVGVTALLLSTAFAAAGIARAARVVRARGR